MYGYNNANRDTKADHRVKSYWYVTVVSVACASSYCYRHLMRLLRTGFNLFDKRALTRRYHQQVFKTGSDATITVVNSF